MERAQAPAEQEVGPAAEREASEPVERAQAPAEQEVGPAVEREEPRGRLADASGVKF